MTKMPEPFSVPRKRGRPRKQATLSEAQKGGEEEKDLPVAKTSSRKVAEKASRGTQAVKRTRARKGKDPSDEEKISHEEEQGEKKQERKTLTADALATRVQEVLLELMAESESDAVRVSAAKTLLDKLKIPRRSNDNSETNIASSSISENENRLVEEAALLLEQLTAAKSGGLSLSPALDQDGKACSTDPHWDMARLADHGRTGVGKDPDRR